MTRYYVGLNGSREPHPLTPEGGFPSAIRAILWAVQHDIPPVWWPYAHDERDAQPARVGRTEA